MCVDKNYACDTERPPSLIVHSPPLAILRRIAHEAYFDVKVKLPIRTVHHSEETLCGRSSNVALFQRHSEDAS